MFSVLQKMLKKRFEASFRIHLTQPVHIILKDFRWLTQDLANHPMRLAEVVPADTPSTLGAHNAVVAGMHGIHCVPMEDGTIEPLLWWAHFPVDIVKGLVSPHNPARTMTNIELELAGGVAQMNVLAQTFDVQEKTVHNLSDNVATVWWQRKGSVSSPGPTSHFIKIQALHQHHFSYVPLYNYILGGQYHV
jgi:hypothetical protein